MNREMRIRSTRAKSDLSVGQLTIAELQKELNRRVENLRARRQALTDELREIDQQLAESGITDGLAASTPAPVRRRPKNAVPLKAVVIDLLRAEPRTTRQLADAALATGYETTSKNFANNVGVVLNTDERFKKVDGRWTVDEN